MAGLLGQAGYTLSDTIEEASLIILETCAIRQKAEDKVHSLLGRLAKRRAAGESLKIAVCGCMVTDDAARGLVKRGANIILGPRRIARIAETVQGEETVIDIGDEWLLPTEDISAPDIPGFSAFVTVMQGCSNACSFCVVPSRRGAAQSKDIDVILEEIRTLERKGYREVTLLGQNISYYGLDRPKAPRLIDLLSKIDAETSLERVRFATSHPAYVDRRFIEGFAGLTKVMPHFHLPVQSGSDRLLKAMRRGYTVERYLDIIEAVRKARPETSITTDIIAGFDGEEISDHQATLELVETARFDSAYVFAYSERPDTGATQKVLGVSVPREERLRRCGEILDAVSGYESQRKQSLVGQDVEVLIERPGVGRSPQNVIVKLEGGRAGEKKQMRIETATAHFLSAH